ncbi:MAG TPA: HAMP domain-containing protein, partial [Gemmatimonadaceae bacterium]|nr:HAMP domain-containing protein [Gemmatimonadaceae bacterium]
MSFRARLTIALVVIAMLPVLILGLGVRREMTGRLDAEAARRLASVGQSVDAELEQTLAADRARLHSLATGLAEDNRFRLAIADPQSPERRWLLDWAPASMKLAGFTMLQLQDSTGAILSAGQFRNDYGREDPAVPRALLDAAGHAAVIDARTPDGPARTLATVDSFTVAGRRFTLAGGQAFDSARVAQLSTDASIAVRLAMGDVTPTADRTHLKTYPYLDDAGAASARTVHVVLVHDPGPERALRAGITRWLLLTLGGTIIAAVALATLLAARISAPITELAGKTEKLDLDRLNQRFATQRTDEIGALGRTLDALSNRLRTSASRLREAERQATTGDLARQINHDIKNGLAPIRNVLRHLAQVAEQDPASLPTVYAERRGTLESSVQYLDELSRNYARLSPALNRGRCDALAVVREVAASTPGASIQLQLPDSLPPVRADAVVLRRILENLASNAVDALAG